MKYLLIIALLVFTNCTAWDASKEKPLGRGEVRTVSFEGVDYERNLAELSKKDSFKGPDLSVGMEAIQENLVKLDALRRCPVKGKSTVTFVVGTDGSVIKPQVIVSIHPKCDPLAVSAFSGVVFTPAMLDGEPIAIRSTLPINFE